MLNFDIQNHRPLREIVYEELKMQILTGKIVPGTRMMEVELAEDMGVSRTPIREAIRKLEKEGLVTIEPRKGAYASQISTEDMVEILEVRQNMEGLAAYFAAIRMTPAQLQVLMEVEESYNKAIEEGNTPDVIRYDSKFHKLIVHSSNNKVLIQMVEQLQEMVLRFRYLYYDDFKRAEKMPEEHQMIVDAIANNNAEAARDAADLHIKHLKDLVITEGV
ncbi:GntR family transcriptional regulator [Clostridium aminobutyricum]|uniref:GntR family transcriptional regulator n=1 Tax=Clostridium aminobutyricum TaxID=33953 RepID=A0A939DBB6_CLOAM|nr:GntR family transcriptional regulator [Clostridium aminobutyricum]MBN7774123.1 GntR family transcriptional regulator [Clostridium aminobutyricum]